MSAYTFEDMATLESQIQKICSKWGLSVERCKHPTVPNPVFWLFREGVQVATLETTPGEPWLATMMHQSQPYAQQKFDSLHGAFGWVRGMLAKRRV